MKNLKVFPKMFIQTFSILGIIIILIHLSVFFVFPKTYLRTRKDEIINKADEISSNINGKGMSYVEETLDFYSKNSDIKTFIKGKNTNNEIEIKDELNIDPNSDNNSLIIEEREILLNTGKKIQIQFVSTADMQKEAKNMSFKFLPYSLLISLLLSVIISLIYAKSVKNNIQEIKNVTDKMMVLDKNALIKVDSTNEVGQLKEQINDLYCTLLEAISDLESKNSEILKLEKLKDDFFKGASHELKTPLASLKIILENMLYNIGKYKDRDTYISESIDIVDDLTHNISQNISVSSIEHLKNDEEILKINDILVEVLKKYEVLINQKKITVRNDLAGERIYIGKTALNIVLSNLLGNAVKYSGQSGIIKIGSDGEWFFIENSYESERPLDIDRLFRIEFDLNRENSNGLGLYIVSNLLNNYKIEYEAGQNDGYFIFKIKTYND